jgi:hypothetical protein
LNFFRSAGKSGIPCQGSLCREIKSKPTLRTPNTDQVAVSLIQVIARVQSPDHPSFELKRDHCRVLHSNWLSTHVANKTTDFLDVVFSDVFNQVQVVNPMENQFSTSSLLLEASRLMVRGVLQSWLIRNPAIVVP